MSLTTEEFTLKTAERLKHLDVAELESLYRNVRTTIMQCQRHRVKPEEGFRATMVALGDLLSGKMGEDKFETLLDAIDKENENA